MGLAAPAGTKWPLTKLRIPGRRRVLSLRWPTSLSTGRCCHLAVSCKNARPERTLGHKRRCKGSSASFRITSDSGRIVAAQKSAASCHVSTARGWQGISTSRRWSVQPCVRPVGAVHMTAGHNALRGSGPGQKNAFDDALARVGCPDRRIDRLCFTCCSPFQLSHHAIRGAISLDLQRRRIIVPRARSHHCPSHSRKLVGKRDRRNFGRPSRQ